MTSSMPEPPTGPPTERIADEPGDRLVDRARRHARLARSRLAREVQGYDDGGEVPLPGYAASLVAFGVAVGAGAVAGRRSGKGLPERYDVADIALGALATHKFTRLLSKGSVTSPLRAAFTEFDEPAGSAELNESARGGRVRHTIGELLTCPFCLGQWVGTGYVAGLGMAPRATRAWAAVFAVTALADGMHQVYARLRDE